MKNQLRTSDFTPDPVHSELIYLAPLDSEWFRENFVTVQSPCYEIPEEHMLLANRILDALPNLLPSICCKFMEYAKDIPNIETFRELLEDPVILLPDLDDPEDSWSFCVDRPSVISTYGYHVVFSGFKSRKFGAVVSLNIKYCH